MIINIYRKGIFFIVFKVILELLLQTAEKISLSLFRHDAWFLEDVGNLPKAGDQSDSPTLQNSVKGTVPHTKYCPFAKGAEATVVLGLTFVRRGTWTYSILFTSIWIGTKPFFERFSVCTYARIYMCVYVNTHMHIFQRHNKNIKCNYLHVFLQQRITKCCDGTLCTTFLLLYHDNHRLYVYRIPSFVLLLLRIISQKAGGQLTEVTAPCQQGEDLKSFENRVPL